MAYSLIFFTSGTPINIGQRECAFERWLGYHAGKHGTGWRRRATAIPLATGAAVHNGIGLIGGWVMDWQGKYPSQLIPQAALDDVTAWAATEAADTYERTARSRGLELTKTDLDAAAAIEQLILEQRTLIEAQVWLYALARLPVMLAQATLIAVEHEETPVLDCTCGLGNWAGSVDAHVARGCAGICAQGRADAIWRLADGSLAYEEIKTKATSNYGWEQQWEHSGQLWLNMSAAERRLGEPVSTAYVPVLFKGKRDRISRDDKQSPRIQQSPLCYGWFDPGNGMNRQAEWSARYRWVDDWGKWHTLGGMYKRQPIWDEAVPLTTPVNQLLPRKGASRVEQWVKGWVQPSQYPELLRTLGPFPKPAILAQEAERSLLVEERRWRDDVSWMREVGLFEPSDVVQTENGPISAADVIARSWSCTKFSGDPCAFKKICHREPGWESMTDHPDFEIRAPHHSTELEAMTTHVESLGLQWPSDDEEDE